MQESNKEPLATLLSRRRTYFTIDGEGYYVQELNCAGMKKMADPKVSEFDKMLHLIRAAIVKKTVSGEYVPFLSDDQAVRLVTRSKSKREEDKRVAEIVEMVLDMVGGDAEDGGGKGPLGNVPT